MWFFLKGNSWSWELYDAMAAQSNVSHLREVGGLCPKCRQRQKLITLWKEMERRLSDARPTENTAARSPHWAILLTPMLRMERSRKNNHIFPLRIIHFTTNSQEMSTAHCILSTMTFDGALFLPANSWFLLHDAHWSDFVRKWPPKLFFNYRCWFLHFNPGLGQQIKWLWSKSSGKCSGLRTHLIGSQFEVVAKRVCPLSEGT